MPAEPATSEGVSTGTGEDVGYLTKEEAGKLPTSERIAQQASEIQLVFGDEDSGAGVKKTRRRRMMSPVERAVSATAGTYQVNVTPVDNKLDKVNKTTPEARRKVSVLEKSQGHANHILDHLANGSCADGECTSNTASVVAPSPTIGRRASAGLEEKGPAHDAWNAAHDAIMRFGNHFKALPGLIESKRRELASRGPNAQAMLDDLNSRNEITSADYAHVSQQIKSAKYAPAVKELGKQTEAAPMSELEKGVNKVVSLQADLDILKAPDGKFRTSMDPNALHGKIKAVANSIYGLHQNAKRTALHAFGLATPLSDGDVKGVTSLAHSLQSNIAPIPEGSLPRDVHPTLAERDLYGNITNPEVALAPHGHVWSEQGSKTAKKVGQNMPLDVLPVHPTILEGYEAAGLDRTPEARRMTDLLKFHESNQPGYKGRPYKLKNKFYNPDGTPFVQRKLEVPATPGTAAADIQNRANMTQKERDEADAKVAEDGVESGTHVRLSSPRFAGRDTYISGGAGAIMQVSAQNLQRLERVLGTEHSDTALMDNALRKNQGRPSREEEAAAPPKENYEGPAHSFGTEETGEGLIDLPRTQAERQTGASKQFSIKEAHDHIVMGTGTGVAYRGQIPADLRRLIGPGGIGSALKLAEQTRERDSSSALYGEPETNAAYESQKEEATRPESSAPQYKYDSWDAGEYTPPTTNLDEHIKANGDMILAPSEIRLESGMTFTSTNPRAKEWRKVRQDDLDKAKRDYDDAYVRHGGRLR
jgi:hypothetical protein